MIRQRHNSMLNTKDRTNITRVINRRTHSFDEYIGRGSIWGNPYTVEHYGRDKCIEMYEVLIRRKLEQDPTLVTKLMALQGKVLGCYCKPQKCHGDVLVQLIEEYGNEPTV